MRVQMETEEDYDSLSEQSHLSKWHLLNLHREIGFTSFFLKSPLKTHCNVILDWPRIN